VASETQSSSSSRAVRTSWAWLVGTVFGIGRLKPGPGTYGSAAALLIWYAVFHVSHPTLRAQAFVTLAAALVVTLIGIPASDIVARESGRPDPGAGQLFALIAIPADWKHALLALLLFRLFDIFKPPPIRNLEKLHGGFGIMLDDVAAGLAALLCGYLLPILFIALRFWSTR
jgi:phosphatidylglycerophosphatase A